MKHEPTSPLFDAPQFDAPHFNAPMFDASASDTSVDDKHDVDPDLALLEAYLDGELSAGEARVLENRLEDDAELSAALSRLSAEYAARRAVWTGLEGTPAEVNRVAWGLSRAVLATSKASVWRRSRRLVGWASAAAACVVCFSAGWVGRGNAVTAAATNSPKPAAAAAPLVYQVALTDEEGNITAIQKFDKLEDAQAFAADLGRWQARQQQLQSGQAILTTTGL